MAHSYTCCTLGPRNCTRPYMTHGLPDLLTSGTLGEQARPFLLASGTFLLRNTVNTSVPTKVFGLNSKAVGFLKTGSPGHGWKDSGGSEGKSSNPVGPSLRGWKRETNHGQGECWYSPFCWLREVRINLYSPVGRGANWSSL